MINTARGEIVDEPDMIEALTERPDLFAVLDVTKTEPPPGDSMLYVLPNVALTPHIAGCTGGDCRRLGRCMIEETRRFLNGEELLWQITREKLAILA